ncbi:Mediator of RNA polymerase II transcription subunit 23 [Armadillidium vulgare]|nr:hypothetical protein Avbf_09024 [Armadillidium vulgare]RXG55615.1 Mediator of RNA polymerase II transcription subunit 23 [Armadillidium vulgare]
MKERLRPMLKTEEQLIVLCHVVAPFLQRFYTEVGQKLFEVPLELYEALAVVDKCASEMKYQDAICDLLYHIKYMFTGDTIKNDIEDLIKSLRPSLKLRLRFITHSSIEDIESITSTTTNATITIPTTSTPTTSNNKSNDSRTSTTTLGSEPFAHEELAIPGPSTESIDISIAESKKRSHSDDSDDDRKRKCNCGGRSDDSNSYIKEQKKLSEDLIKITNLSSNKICESIEEGVQILATQLKRIADILEKKQT